MLDDFTGKRSGSPQLPFFFCVISFILGGIFLVVSEVTEMRFFLFPAFLGLGFYFVWALSVVIYAIAHRRKLSWALSAVIIYGALTLLLIFGK